MRALTFDRYTDADGLHVSDVADPSPAADEVLVRVHAAGLNAFDWHQYRGEPLVMRAQTGLRVREPRIVGADAAGVVEAVGADVTDLAPGDRVMGEIGRGTVAELLAGKPEQFVCIDPEVSVAAAAATPMGGLTALQALRDTAALSDGDRVLVWGASGGVGHLAVQIARLLGASRVDAVCSGGNAAMVRGLGADAVVDYTTHERPAGPYDVILDTVSTERVSGLKPLLSHQGRVVTVGALGGGRLLGPVSSMIGRGVAAKVRGVRVSPMLAQSTSSDLATLAGWLADGSLTPVIARTVALDEAAAACAELEAGHVAGKLVVSLV